MTNLVGKNILIVDEVDDTRTTLEYAVRELQKDVETAAQKLGSNEKTQFSIFVLHVSDPFGPDHSTSNNTAYFSFTRYNMADETS